MKQIVDSETGQSIDIGLPWLPMCITGVPGAGASLFTMTLAARLFGQGEKLLIISGYTMAVEELGVQIAEPVSLVSDENELNPDRQLLYLEPQNVALLNQALDTLSDVEQRVVLIKNYELYCDVALLARLVKVPRLLLSGEDLPKIDVDWKSRAIFDGTDPTGKYIGKLTSNHGQQRVSVV